MNIFRRMREWWKNRREEATPACIDDRGEWQTSIDSFSFLPTSPQRLECLFELHNAFRREQGLNELQLSPELAATARTRAEQVVLTKRIRRTGRVNVGFELRREGYRWLSVGEILAFGYASGPEAFVAWLQSPSHRQTIANSNYRHVGFGVAETGDGLLLWCTVFAEPAKSISPTMVIGCAETQESELLVHPDQSPSTRPSILSMERR